MRERIFAEELKSPGTGGTESGILMKIQYAGGQGKLWHLVKIYSIIKYVTRGDTYNVFRDF